MAAVQQYITLAKGIAEERGEVCYVATIGDGYAIFRGLQPESREKGVYPSRAYRWWRVYPGGRVEQREGR